MGHDVRGETEDRSSAWDRYLATLDDAQKSVATEWVESRPPAVRSLLRRFPPGSTFLLDGRKAYIVGVAETTEDPGLLLSWIDPGEDYEGAVASKFLVCRSHLA